MVPPFQYLAAAVMLGLAAASLAWLPRRLSLIPMAFAGWATLSIAWSIDPIGSALRGIVLVIYIVAAIGLIRSPEFEKATVRTAIASYLGILALAIVLGPEPRTLGGINPNTIGSFGLGATLLLALAGRLRWWWIVLLSLLLLYTQSRTLLITWGLFLALWPLVGFFARLGVAPVVSLGFTLVTMPGILFFYGLLVQGLIAFSRVIGVTSSKRLDSTFTDRTQFWTSGLEQFGHQPFTGFGYGTRENKAVLNAGDMINSHSGLINLLLDLGMVGLTLLLLWYVAALWKSATGVRGWHPSVTRTNGVILIALIPTLIAQPTYLNLYDPTSIAFLFSMCLPFAPRPIRDTRPLHRIPPAESAASHGAPAPAQL
jgi:O-antigen ligase